MKSQQQHTSAVAAARGSTVHGLTEDSLNKFEGWDDGTESMLIYMYHNKKIFGGVIMIIRHYRLAVSFICTFVILFLSCSAEHAL